MTLSENNPFRSLRSLAWARVTMARRLGLAFGLVLTLFAGTTAFALWQMKSMEQDMQSAIHASTVVSAEALVVRDTISAFYLSGLMMALSTSTDDVLYQSKVMEKSVADYRAAKGRLLASTHGGKDIPGLVAALGAVTESELIITTMSRTVSGRASDAKAAGPDATLPLDADLQGNVAYNIKGQIDIWVTNAQKLVECTAAATKDTVANAEASARAARWVLIVAAGAALLVGVAAAWLIARSVTVPMRKAVFVAEQVAQGDLSQVIVNHATDETGALLNALSRMQDSLHDLVGEVRSSAHSIELASTEVAAGSNDLSQRTEQTASNLQRTNSSMEQLTGSVKQSAGAAETAHALVSSAARCAERGGEVVAEVVLGMQAIADQSRKIADIIGVIDGIAFQTNILALNAAVEAARAGEQGRGFAVVAGEVRNLAQRAAAAAKDIKGLIGASVDKVESGSRLVKDAGATMNEIVGSVRKVNDMIRDITISAAAQSQGIGEVGGSMSQLDEMTQQNAALVEQSAAAAESLQSHARHLSKVVSTFTLRA